MENKVWRVNCYKKQLIRKGVYSFFSLSLMIVQAIRVMGWMNIIIRRKKR